MSWRLETLLAQASLGPAILTDNRTISQNRVFLKPHWGFCFYGNRSIKWVQIIVMILHLGKLMNRESPPLLELCQYRKTGRSWIWLCSSQPTPRFLPTTASNRLFFIYRDVCLQGSMLVVNLQKTPKPQEGCLPWNCLSSLFRPRYLDCHQTWSKGGTEPSGSEGSLLAD